MRWEELTSDDFARAVKDCQGVCVIPLSAIERHGSHLPLGTDMYEGHAIAEAAARLEKAVIFPPFYLTQILEGKCFPGTISLPPRLMVDLLLSVYDEIGRNGFTKIITYIAHGGNKELARFLCQCQLESAKSYQLYVVDFTGGMNEAQTREWMSVLDLKGASHADEVETSIVLAARPELVKMDRIKGPAPAMGRLKHLGKGQHALAWFGDYPDHYADDARPATAEKGRHLIAHQAKALAAFIRTVKKDGVSENLAKEFWAREAALRKKPKKL